MNKMFALCSSKGYFDIIIFFFGSLSFFFSSGASYFFFSFMLLLNAFATQLAISNQLLLERSPINREQKKTFNIWRWLLLLFFFLFHSLLHLKQWFLVPIFRLSTWLAFHWISKRSFVFPPRNKKKLNCLFFSSPFFFLLLHFLFKINRNNLC